MERRSSKTRRVTEATPPTRRSRRLQGRDAKQTEKTATTTDANPTRRRSSRLQDRDASQTEKAAAKPNTSQARLERFLRFNTPLDDSTRTPAEASTSGRKRGREEGEDPPEKRSKTGKITPAEASISSKRGRESKQLYIDYQSLKNDVETRISNQDTTITLDLLTYWNQQAKVLGGSEALELRKTIGISRMALSKKIFDMRYDTPKPHFLITANDIVNKFNLGSRPMIFEVKTMLKSVSKLLVKDFERVPQYTTYFSKKNKQAIINRCYKNEDEKRGKGDEGEVMALSDILSNQFSRVCEYADKNIDCHSISIETFYVNHVIESRTLDALSKYFEPPSTRRLEFDPSHEDFEEVIKKTPFVKAVQYYLDQHPNTLGRRKVCRVVLWKEPAFTEAFNMEIYTSESSDK